MSRKRWCEMKRFMVITIIAFLLVVGCGMNAQAATATCGVGEVNWEEAGIGYWIYPGWKNTYTGKISEKTVQKRRVGADVYLPLANNKHQENVIKYSYDKNGDLVGYRDRVMPEDEKYIYNDKHQLVAVRMRGWKQALSYDDNGNVKMVGDSTTYFYKKGRVIRSRTYNPGMKINGKIVDIRVRYHYDKRGNLIKMVSSSGVTVNLSYDDLGRLLLVQSSGINRRFEYDEDGYLSRMYDGENQQYDFKYETIPSKSKTTSKKK